MTLSTREVQLVNLDSSSSARSECGASLVEYVLLIMLIAIIAIAGVRAMGTHLSGTFSDITSRLDDEMHPN